MYSFLYKKKEDGLNGFLIALLFFCAVVFLAGALFLFNPARQALKKIIANMPTKARLTVIVPDNCDDCFDIYQVTDFIGTIADLEYKKVKEYKASNANADLLISAYEINVLPTFVLQGKLSELELDSLFGEDNIGYLDEEIFVYKNTYPPYQNLETGEIRGEFEMTYLDDEKCDKCYDVRNHDFALSNLAMAPTATSTVDISSADGRALLNKYAIKHVPTILIEGDMDAYKNFNEIWETVGTIEKDGVYIFREKGMKQMGAYENAWTKRLYNEKKE